MTIRDIGKKSEAPFQIAGIQLTHRVRFLSDKLGFRPSQRSGLSPRIEERKRYSIVYQLLWQLDIRVETLCADAHLTGEREKSIQPHLVDLAFGHRRAHRATGLVRMTAVVEAATP